MRSALLVISLFSMNMQASSNTPSSRVMYCDSDNEKASGASEHVDSLSSSTSENEEKHTFKELVRLCKNYLKKTGEDATEYFNTVVLPYVDTPAFAFSLGYMNVLPKKAAYMVVSFALSRAAFKVYKNRNRINSLYVACTNKLSDGYQETKEVMSFIGARMAFGKKLLLNKLGLLRDNFIDFGDPLEGLTLA